MRSPLTATLALQVCLAGACSHSQHAQKPAPSAAEAERQAPSAAAPEEPHTESRVPEGEPQVSPRNEPSEAPPFVRAAVEAQDREAADRALDVQRKPEALLTFAGVQPGMRVAELAAGGGYTAELLARVVGDRGQVYAQNSPEILKRFAEVPWKARLQKPAMANVVRLDREFDDPFPADVKDLDAVTLVLFYHDTVWFGTDRGAMNRAVFRALKPGGTYLVVDHSARHGAGVSEAESRHRIEEQTVVQEVESAGFELVGTADFLRNPKDARDWNASPRAAGERRGESDRFVLKFIKPLDRAPGAGVSPLTACDEPRRPMCTREYRPVCGERDTGVRCITTPCPSREQRTYPNACAACADNKVVGYRDHACVQPASQDASDSKDRPH